MCKRDLLEKIISIVCDLTEIEREEVLSKSRRSDVTEARCLLIYLLKVNGVKPYKIAVLLDIPERSVYYAITSFSLHSDQPGSMLGAWLKEANSKLQKLCNKPAATSQ